ncbi:MAG: TetR family transcriptional regulator [Mycobacteriaceae bacterium]|nr:TetR family transcriptional regulator [Mycobacteriaceae bacterium]
MEIEATRRRLTGRQADTVDRLTKSAVEILGREGFAGLTIRMVATAAGVGSATAYTYFSSKEHLVAEVYWRRLRATPPPLDDELGRTARVLAVLRNIALLVADEPELAHAVTAALLSRDPDVEHLRVRIGQEIRRRLSDAWGKDPDPIVLQSLEMLYTGALVRAGIGESTYPEAADLMAKAAEFMLR